MKGEKPEAHNRQHMLPKPTINSTMCKNSHPKHERKKSDQPSRVIHPIPCHLFSPETVVQNEQAARKEEHGTSQADRKTNADRTTATEHEHDTNDMSPTPLHSTTNHPRLGDPKMVWYQGGSGVGIVGVGDDIAGTEELECA